MDPHPALAGGAMREHGLRVSGAGVPIRTKKTGSGGAARFYLKATRYPGKVTFKVWKSGYTTAYLYRSVRLA